MQAGGSGGEGAAALQTELVQMERPGEQAVDKIDVRQDQVCGIHPTHRGHPHPAWGALKQVLAHLGSAPAAEERRMGRDRHWVGQHRMTQVHRGVAKAKGCRRFPTGSLEAHCKGRDLQ